MKLSEAIGLGSTVVKATPGVFARGRGEQGCALGMAWVAIGGGWGEPTEVTKTTRTGGDAVVQEWPMLAKIERRPCTCWLLRRNMQVRDIIAHLFDRHVFGKTDWTIDGLREWVASVEPKEVQPSFTMASLLGTIEQRDAARIQQEMMNGLRQA